MSSWARPIVLFAVIEYHDVPGIGILYDVSKCNDQCYHPIS